MSEPPAPPPPPWWEALREGEPTWLAFVKIDRAGSTKEWDALPQDTVFQRRRGYFAGVESIARQWGAVWPITNWQGDGVMLFFGDAEGESAVMRAFRAARALWERVRIELNLDARIAVHTGLVPWNMEVGKIAGRDLDLCGHLEHAGPVNGVTLSEDLYLELPPEQRRECGPLGLALRDGTPAYVFPKGMTAQANREHFGPATEMELWQAFRTYAESAEIRLLRYVGFDLTKKEPPSLEIREVFVPLEVQARRLRRPKPLPSQRQEDEHPEDEDLLYGLPDDDEVSPELPFRMWEESELGPPQPFGALFRDHRAVVILGEPGSGKTTLLKWLAVVAQDGRRNLHRQLGVAERLLPLPVSVGRLAEIRQKLLGPEPGGTVSVPEAMAHYFHDRVNRPVAELAAFIEARLNAGEGLVLLDGLDEVKKEDREVIRNWLETCATSFPGNRCLVTSRLVGYVGFDLPDRLELTLQPFSDAQVDQYVRCFTQAYHRWDTGTDDKPAAVREAERLLGAITESARLRALARNPFILSGLALIHRAEGRLPRHRVQFYEKFARCLCISWDTARRLVPGTAAPKLSYEEEAVPILGRLAYRMHCDYPAGRAPREFVIQALMEALQEVKGVPEQHARLAAESFLRRAGEQVQLFLERGPDEWGFLHLTFQEFFAAAGLHAEERFETVAREHLFDPRWEEVIRLGVGYMALVQKRPRATRNFVASVLDEAKSPARPWITETLQLQVPIAALLAAEAGDALSAELQVNIAQSFVAWAKKWSFPTLAERIFSELALTDFKDSVAKPYLASIKSQDPRLRAKAAECLGLLKVEAAVPDLLEALKDKEARVRCSAAGALGNLKVDTAVPPLLDAVRDKEGMVRRSASEALGNLKVETVQPALLEALMDTDSWVRQSAAKALCHLKAGAALLPLLEKLKDKESLVRNNAAEALGELKVEAAVPTFLEMLKDEDPMVRGSAASALGGMKAQTAVPGFLRMLNDKDWLVRTSAAVALGNLRTEAAVPALLESLGDDEPRVRGNAARALGNLRSEAAVPALLESLKDDEPKVRGNAARALGNMRAEAAVPALLQSLKDPEAKVRWNSAWALGNLKAEPAVPALLELLKDHEPKVRANAARALGNMKAEVAVPALLESLRDQEPKVRWNSAWALGKMKAETAISALIEGLRDEEPWVLRIAARALGEMKADTAVPALLRRLNDKNPEVRGFVAEALLRIAGY